MTKLEQLQDLWREQAQFFEKLTKFCAEGQIEAENAAQKHYSRKGNVIYPECFQKPATGQRMNKKQDCRQSGGV